MHTGLDASPTQSATGLKLMVYPLLSTIEIGTVLSI